MCEWGADGPVPLSRDGHHHEDGGSNEEALEGVKDVWEADPVPVGLRKMLAANECSHSAIVKDIVDQEQGVHNSWNKRTGFQPMEAA